MISFKQFLESDETDLPTFLELVNQYSPTFTKRVGPVLPLSGTKLTRKMRTLPVGSKTITYTHNGKIHSAYIVPAEKNRKPIDSSISLHKYAGEWFEKHFGHNYRSNAVFAGSDTSGYSGERYLIFPIGKWSYVWSTKIADLYGDFPGIFRQTDLYDGENSKHLGATVLSKNLTKEMVFATMDIADYTNNDIYMALAEGHEIMIDCDEYLAVRWDDIA